MLCYWMLDSDGVKIIVWIYCWWLYSATYKIYWKSLWKWNSDRNNHMRGRTISSGQEKSNNARHLKCISNFDLQNQIYFANVMNKNKTYRQAEDHYRVPKAVIYNKIAGKKTPMNSIEGVIPKLYPYRLFSKVLESKLFSPPQIPIQKLYKRLQNGWFYY